MRKVFFECIGGASGDMILAALIDLGANVEKIKNNLQSLNFKHHEKIDIEIEEAVLNGIKGIRARVIISESASHHHNEHIHHHRGYSEIRTMIEQSKLSPFVKKHSIAIFKRLGEAEAKVHNKSIDEIHFHEVGALDSIIDIVGSCTAIEELGIEELAAGAFPCGHGTIICAHGVLPNPAPAMLLLTEGHKIEYVDEPYELVTPTAAALLTSFSQKTNFEKPMNVLKVGYGIGHRKLNNRPNILRATLLDWPNESISSSIIYERCSLLETNIDDMSPELMGALFERLLQGGALDVFYTPIYMKKHRPAYLLSVLCDENKKASLLKIIFTESTTLGVRESRLTRYVLPRSTKTIHTDYGELRVKIASLNGTNITIAPEYEDCLKLANEKGISLKKVYEAAISAITSQNLQKE